MYRDICVRQCNVEVMNKSEKEGTIYIQQKRYLFSEGRKLVRYMEAQGDCGRGECKTYKGKCKENKKKARKWRQMKKNNGK